MTSEREALHSLTRMSGDYVCRRCGQTFRSVMHASGTPCPGTKEKSDG